MRKMLAFIVGIILLVIVGLFIYFNVNKSNEQNIVEPPKSEEKYENKELKISELENEKNYLENGDIEISNLSLAKMAEKSSYTFSFSLLNKSMQEYNLTNYKIGFFDLENNNIITVGGSALGELEPGESSSNSVTIPTDLSKAETIRFYKIDD